MGALLGCLLRGARNIGGNHDVLQGGELGQQLVELEDKADVAIAEVGELLLTKLGSVDVINTYGAGVGSVEGAEDLE